jgi:hypothetical protein
MHLLFLIAIGTVVFLGASSVVAKLVLNQYFPPTDEAASVGDLFRL